MRKFIVRVVVALVVLCGASFYVYKTNDASETYENKESKEVNNMLSMMLETSAGSGEYQQTTASVWPTEGYVFNESLSKCEKGSSLSWDNVKKKVMMNGNLSDKCYVYFDKEPETLANYIKSQYTGIQGENNLYLHDSTLENGAGDNSYRYAGSSETTNNFVCFGYDSQDGSCPTDFLYRIIGVFDNQVKLIKYDYAHIGFLGTDGDYANSVTPFSTYKGNLTSMDTYYWNYYNDTNINYGYGSHEWSTSLLNTINLNTYYLDCFGTYWSDKIVTHTWKVGGNTPENIIDVTVPNTYINEITNPAENKTYDAKVGLMYASDYGYAAAPSAWTTILDSYDNSSVTGVNWMYMGMNEHIITPYLYPSDDVSVFSVLSTGCINGNPANTDLVIRPVFYLTADTSYKSGNGSISSPIIINR